MGAINGNATLRLVIAATLSSALDLASGHSDLAYDKLLSVLANGVGSNQANQIWSDTRTLISAGNETLDLNASLVNAFGESVTFTKIKVMVIVNKGTTDLTIGNAAANQWATWLGAVAHTITVPAGGALVLTNPGAGFAVTAATGDQLKITNAAGASCDYDIILMGVN
jgi:hypothetical protein